MIKRIVILLLIAALSLPTPALAAEPGSGIIEGRVVNGTENGSSVANQEITLSTYLNDNEVDSTTAKTDAEGLFIFDGLSSESGYSYQVTLTFQEADYSSEMLSFDDGETSKFAEVSVYDSTTSGEAIKVAMAHTIVYIGQGSLEVIEYFLFVNESDRTYIGSKEVTADGTKETLQFALPEEATGLQPSIGLMECCIYDSEGGFVDTMPVLPGGRETAYSYKVNYSSGQYTFSRRVNYPTADYNLLVQGEGTTVASNQLTAAELLNIEGILFQHISGKDLAPGSTLEASISGLPQTNNEGAFIWVALALAVLTGVFGLFYLAKRKGKVQPVSTRDNLAQKRQRLLLELAQLDDEFEGDKIAEDVYHRLRIEKKAQLVALMQRSKEDNR